MDIHTIQYNNSTILKDQLEVEFITTSRCVCIYINIYERSDVYWTVHHCDN